MRTTKGSVSGGVVPMLAKGIKVPLAVGALGVIVHLLFIRCVAYWSYPAPADRSFVNNFFVNIGFGILGGMFYALLLKQPVIDLTLGGRSLAPALIKGGLWGMVATVAASQGIFLAAAVFLAFQMKAAVPEGSLVTAFELAALEIETYGLIEVSYILIPAFVGGTLITAVVAYFVGLYRRG
jgi:hypothetical protein